MHAQNLTKGPIARPPGSIWRPPLLLGSILQQLYNTIDALIIGRYRGQAAFAAIGVAGTVMNLFIFSLKRMLYHLDFAVLRLYGSGDEKQFEMPSFFPPGWLRLTALLSPRSLHLYFFAAVK